MRIGVAAVCWSDVQRTPTETPRGVVSTWRHLHIHVGFQASTAWVRAHLGVPQGSAVKPDQVPEGYGRVRKVPAQDPCRAPQGSSVASGRVPQVPVQHQSFERTLLSSMAIRAMNEIVQMATIISSFPIN